LVSIAAELSLEQWQKASSEQMSEAMDRLRDQLRPEAEQN